MTRRTFALTVCSLALCSLTIAVPRAAVAQTARREVLATIDTMLLAMRTKNATLMTQQLDSLARMTLLRPAPGGGVRVVALSGEEFVRVATAANQPPLDEPIRNPVVQINGDLATVWAEYQVRREGRVTHCGYDAFHLVRKQGRWRVLNVSDTYRQTGCGAAW
jgi:hypothetical protein